MGARVEELLGVLASEGGEQTARAAEELVRLQELVRGVPVADEVISYAVRLSAATRPGESMEIEGVHKYLLYGASPRASQYLALGAKARAILEETANLGIAQCARLEPELIALAAGRTPGSLRRMTRARVEKIDAAGGDVFRYRPKLGKLDWLRILGRLIAR